MNRLIGNRLQTFEHSVSRQAPLCCARTRGDNSNENRVMLGTASPTLFPSIFKYFISSCYGVPGRWHALCFLRGRMTPTRTRTVNLNARSRMHIASWTLRTLLDTDTRCIFLCAFDDYGIDIVCLCQVLLLNPSSRCIQVPRRTRPTGFIIVD